MKNRLIVRLLTSLFLVAALSGHAEEKPGGSDKPMEKTRPYGVVGGRDSRPVEKAPVTFLGVETAPVGDTLAAQLGLPADIGLVLVRVLADSPAAGLLKEHDILTKFDDQLLIDSRQLSVLVRGRKEGEEVKLTLYRAGKETVIKVRLGQRELPPVSGLQGFPPGGSAEVRFFNEELPGSGERWTHRLPGMEPEDVHNVLRMIGRERHNWFGAPPVHFFRREDEKGSTMLNLAEGNFVFSDASGTVEVKAGEGNRELTVRNSKGEIAFQGPINNAEDREKLPPEVLARLRKIENVELNDEPGEDFEQETAVEPPVKIRISRPLRVERSSARVPLPPPPF